MLDVVSKFGGVQPHSISEYYRGGFYVPNNWNGTGGVPTSGQISFDQLQSARKEGYAWENLQHAYNQRSYVHRTGGNPSYDGNIVDSVSFGDYSANNGWPNRYQSSAVISMGYAGNSLNQAGTTGYSEWTTLIVVANGSSSFYGTLINGYPPAVNYNDGSNSKSVGVFEIGLPLNLITSFYTYYTRGDGNYGTWSKWLLVPGRWTVYNDAYFGSPTSMYNTGFGNTTPGYADYQWNVPAGGFVFVNRSGGIDGRSMYISNYDGSTYPGFENFNAVTGENWWWYNSSTIFSAWNTSSNAITGKIARTVYLYGATVTANNSTFADSTRITTFYKYA